MSERKRSRILTQILLGGALLGVLVFGAFHATEAGTESTLPAIELFTDVLSKVQNLYVKETNPKELVYSAISGMLENLDSHSAFMTPEMMKDMGMQISGKYGGLGMQIGKVPNGPIRIEGVFDGTPASRAGLQAKDLILKIDGKDTLSLSTEEGANMMRGEPNTNVKIVIQREGWPQPKEFTLTREIIQLKSVRKAEILDNAYGYVYLASFQDGSSDELDKAIAKMEKTGIKGLILDLRNNPGGPLKEAIMVSDLFISNGVIVSIKGRPGQSRDNQEFTAKAAGTHADYPMIVLVNSGSASASEIVAGALQDHGRAVLVGTKTFGKGSVQTILTLNDGSGLKLTTALYYTPSGRSIQATGIEPEIVVENAPRPAPGQQSQQGGRLIRESDLPNHFQNPNTAPNGEVPKTAPGANDMEEGEEDEPPPPAEDLQLKRALELLKSWTIFQGVQQKRAAAATR